MLAINVTVQGDKVAIEGLQQFAADMPKAVQRGLKRVVRGVDSAAMDFLNGPGRSSMRLTNNKAVIGDESGKITKQKTRLRGQSDSLDGRPGSYPVPVITGNLKRLLDFVDPGQSKTSKESKTGKGVSATFTAGPLEAVVYDSAAYASVIRFGTGSSSAYGQRDFLGDALDKFNQGGQIEAVLEDEIRTEITRKGLA